MSCECALLRSLCDSWLDGLKPASRSRPLFIRSPALHFFNTKLLSHHLLHQHWRGLTRTLVSGPNRYAPSPSPVHSHLLMCEAFARGDRYLLISAPLFVISVSVHTRWRGPGIVSAWLLWRPTTRATPALMHRWAKPKVCGLLLYFSSLCAAAVSRVFSSSSCMYGYQ